MGESLMQSKTSYFSSSSSSTTSTSVKTSRIPVAVEKKSSTIITRQNTYTIESNNLESKDSSTGAKTDALTEDEVDASIESLLKRQNTYTIKTSVSNVEEQSKQNEEEKETKSTIVSAIPETESQKMPLNKTDGMSLQEKDKETPIQEDKVTEDTASLTSLEPSSQHE